MVSVIRCVARITYIFTQWMLVDPTTAGFIYLVAILILETA